jgi:hypothetical protein
MAIIVKQAEYIFNTDSCLRELVKKTELLEKLNLYLQPLLAPEFQHHCKVINFREGILVLQIHQQTLATTLRFTLPDLLSQLRQYTELRGLRSIRLKVAPLGVPAQPITFSPRQLSTSSRRILESLRDYLKGKATTENRHLSKP